jgi:uncharacterized protein HemX
MTDGDNGPYWIAAGVGAALVGVFKAAQAVARKKESSAAAARLEREYDRQAKERQDRIRQDSSDIADMAERAKRGEFTYSGSDEDSLTLDQFGRPKNRRGAPPSTTTANEMGQKGTPT